MSAKSLQEETYEALMGTFYRFTEVKADLLGETDDRDESGPVRIGWWHIGESPRDIRVAIILPTMGKDEVRLRIEWKNYSADARNPLKGEQVLSISTYAADQHQLMAATEAAVLRVLEVYREVLLEEGVAGSIEALAPESEYDPEQDDGEDF